MKPYYDEDGITIYHGDCRDVLPALDVKADLLVTDPPYGVQWNSNRRMQTFAFMQNDAPEDKPEVVKALASAAATLHDNGHVYIFGNLDLSALNLSETSELIWDKGLLGLNGGHFWIKQHETITFGVRLSGARQKELGQGKLSARIRKGSVLRVDRMHGSVTDHPTQKPVLLLRQLIESSSVIGDLVLDPFMGVGSTLVAARIEGRKAIGIEIEESYCEKAATRLAQRVLAFEDMHANA